MRFVIANALCRVFEASAFNVCQPLCWSFLGLQFLTFEIDALMIERQIREEKYIREILPDHSEPQEKSEEIKIAEVLSMKASEFRKRFAGSVLILSKQVFTGEKGDKWVLTQIHDDGGSTLDIPHVPGTINLRFERLKMRSDMSTNEIDLVLRD